MQDDTEKKQTKTKKLTEPVFVLHKYSMRSGGGMGDFPSTLTCKNLFTVNQNENKKCIVIYRH